MYHRLEASKRRTHFKNRPPKESAIRMVHARALTDERSPKTGSTSVAATSGIDVLSVGDSWLSVDRSVVPASAANVCITLFPDSESVTKFVLCRADKLSISAPDTGFIDGTSQPSRPHARP